MSVYQIGSELTSDRGYGSQAHYKYLSKALGIQHHEKITRQACAAVFNQMDEDGSREIDSGELTKWAIDNKVFGLDIDDATVEKITRRLYLDTGAGDNGMTSEGFYKFVLGVQREDLQLSYASRHHLMTMPKSMMKANKKSFNIDAIERELHQKILQATTRDSDRARHVATMFKTQLQRDSGEVDDTEAANGTLSISKPQFRKVLNLLGLFATADQADELFDRYDINGDGDLTIHEFLTKAYPDDYPGMPELDANRYYDFRMGGAGKRLFPDEGIGARPVTPHHTVFALNYQQMCYCIRNAIEQKSRSGIPVSIPNARRKLACAFETADPYLQGTINSDELQKTLQLHFGINYGRNQYQELMDIFADNGDSTKFNYVKFCLSVYPVADQEKEIQTSLVNKSPNSAMVREAKAAADKAARSPMARRSVHSPTTMSQVHTTGFYFKPASSNGPTSPKVNPIQLPSSKPDSRMMSSRLQHQMRMSSSRKNLNVAKPGEWRTPVLP